LRNLELYILTIIHQVCPANWNPGDETIKATPEGNKEYLGKLHADTKMSDVAAKTNGTAAQAH
jgi:peroxiredoxin (alkyl hydroperoxide reductase subunit C)